ncbi:hypothetical protein JCM8097_005481 [Rhodosporidiobolus ruineniae]
MAPPRTRQSAYSARVTLYEPVGAAPSASTASSPSTAVAVVGRASSPARRTRSRSAAVKADSDAALKAEQEEEEEEDLKPKKKAKSPRKPRPHVEALAVPHPAPKEWERVYEIIRKQREGIVAPVDTMGCEQGGRDRAKKEEGGEEDVKPDLESEQDRRLSILVSLMLSSQTKDPVTHQATMNLRQNLPHGLSLLSLETATAEEIDAQICKVGFHNTKAQNLKRLAVTLRGKHEGEVPSDLPSLLAIHGVGPKMAYLYLQAIGENLGIGVDTHVHRITNRLRWHKKETTTPEQTRLNLESWLPKHLWPEVNKMLVGFGQEICRPTAPRCDQCDLAAARLCPSRRVVTTSPAKKRRKVEVEVKEEAKEEVKGEEGGPEVRIEVEVEGVVKAEETVEEGRVEVKKEEDVDGGAEKPTRSEAVREAQEGAAGAATG